jgi:peroxiredoxin
MTRKFLALALLTTSLSLAADPAAPLHLSKYKGKVVLLNFWATWCHGCKEELPWIVDYQTKYKRQGLAVIGISMDEDGWKTVRPFLKTHKLNYPVILGSEALAQQYALDNMPMTILIGRDGKVAATHVGVVDREGCDREIRSLLH